MSYTASYIVNSSSAQGTTDFQFTFPYIKEDVQRILDSYQSRPHLPPPIVELLQFIQALEETFVVDEGLSINKATNILWGLRTLDLNNIVKLTVPTTPYQLNDGRQVLILNGNFYDFAKENLLIEE